MKQGVNAHVVISGVSLNSDSFDQRLFANLSARAGVCVWYFTQIRYAAVFTLPRCASRVHLGGYRVHLGAYRVHHGACCVHLSAYRVHHGAYRVHHGAYRVHFRCNMYCTWIGVFLIEDFCGHITNLRLRTDLDI